MTLPPSGAAIFSLLLVMQPLALLAAEGLELDAMLLPAVPDAEGFAAPFSGVSGGALIVAGGANIPQDKWAETFTKVWYDSAFVLEHPGAKWQTGFKLPRPLGYGLSISVDDSLLCFGGSDATQHYREGFRLKWTGSQLTTTPLPSLPKPCANTCGALVGRTIYLAGGLESPSSTTALHSFWALHLDEPSPAWHELPPWPGPARMLAVAAAAEDCFYLFSGAALSPGADGKAQRQYLKDAYCYSPSKGWAQLADLPRPAVAAPSPALTQQGSIYLFTGDDGANVSFTPLTQHPGFPRTVLVYDVMSDSWVTRAGTPFSRATAPTVLWQDRLVIPNGEVRPRERTSEVWSLKVK